jgi:hypothetical protein
MRSTTPRSSRQGAPLAIDDLRPSYRIRSRADRHSELSRSDFVLWPLSSVVLTQQIGSDRSNSRHAVNVAATQMTHYVISPPSIDAMRKVYSITSLVVTRRLGRNVWPAGKLSSGCRRPRGAGDVTAVQEIADWLKTLGMSEYAERFAENDLDSSVLRHLTGQDLKELGDSRPDKPAGRACHSVLR